MVQAPEEEDGMLLPERRGRSLPITSSDDPSPCAPGRGYRWAVTGYHSGTSTPVLHHTHPTPPSSSQIIPKVASFPRLEVGKPLDGNVTCSLAAFPGDGAGPGAGDAPGGPGDAPGDRDSAVPAAGTARGPRRGGWPGCRLVGQLLLVTLAARVKERSYLKITLIPGHWFGLLTANWLQQSRDVTSPGQRGDSTRARVLVHIHTCSHTRASPSPPYFSGEPQTVSCKCGWV